MAMKRLGNEQPKDGQECFIRFRPDGWTWTAAWDSKRGVWVAPGGSETQSYDDDLWWPNQDEGVEE